MLVAVFFAVVVLAFRPGYVQDTLVDISSGARFVLWDMAWEGIQERPLLGWGLENYQFVSYKFFNPCLGSEQCGGELWFDHAHNKLLDVWVETGLFGLMAYISIFIVAIFSFWRAGTTSPRARRAFIILTAGLVAYFVQNLTALETSTLLLFWVLLLAAVGAISETGSFSSEGNSMDSLRTSRIVPTVASLLFPFAIFFLVIQPVQANLAVRQAIFATEPEQRARAYDTATSLSPVGIDMRRVWLADDTVKTIWQRIPVGTELPAGLVQELNNAADLLEDSLRRSPGNLRARIALGFVYKTKGHFLEDAESYEKATKIFEEGIRLSPSHPIVRRGLASVYLDQGRKEDGSTLMRTLVELSPESPAAYNYYLATLRLIGNQDEFERVASQAIKSFPSLSSDIEQLRRADNQADGQALLYLFH
jgi:hypothetical protein